mmetsp:Transcript_22419/g.76147  ORF Transcript_22419/g.76147 Transcript_22419/m.76147 type:complete len:138 (+) Transcript_22419:33-446(+)
MSKVTGKRLAKPETLVIEESLRRFSDVAYQICTAGQIVAGGNCCTPFQVSSVTKTIGALLVLVIVEHGYISLSTKLCEYIPEWSTKPAYCDITISHLLKQSFLSFQCSTGSVHILMSIQISYPANFLPIMFLRHIYF